MRALILHPCARPDPWGFSNWSPDIGLAVAALQHGGHDVKVLTTESYDEDELRAALAFSPRMIVIHTLSRQADQARALGAFCAMQRTGATVFFSGPHASAWPADCLNVAPGVYALRGFAEHLLAPLADVLATTGDFFSMPGLSFPVMNRFYHNPIEDPPHLAERHTPDRLLSGYQRFVRGLEDSVGAEIVSSRGEFNASDRTQACFDMSAPRSGVVPPFQQRGVAQVVEEANALKGLMPGLRFIGLRDDNCLADPEWVKELCQAWPKHVGLPLWVAARPEFLRESVFEALVSAGCYRIYMSMESGADYVRRKVIGRRCADSHLLYAGRACRRFGIALITCVEVGFPGETEDMIAETIEMNRRMKPDWVLASVFHPEPGSALHQRAENKKWLTPSAYGVFYDPDVRVEQPWIRPRKVDEYLSAFNERVFGPPLLPARR